MRIRSSENHKRHLVEETAGRNVEHKARKLLAFENIKKTDFQKDKKFHF